MRLWEEEAAGAIAVFRCDKCAHRGEAALGTGLPSGWKSSYSTSQNQHFCTECNMEASSFTPTNQAQSVKALHYSTGKLGLDQLDWNVLAQDAAVLNFGEFKYFRANWQNGNLYSEMFGSAMRHLMFWWLGEENDPESGLPHLAHARINLMFLMYWQAEGVGEDNRAKVPGTTDDIRDMLATAIERGKLQHKED